MYGNGNLIPDKSMDDSQANCLLNFHIILKW